MMGGMLHNLKGRFESISEFYDSAEFKSVVEAAVTAARGKGIEFVRIQVFPRDSDRIIIMYVDCGSMSVKLLLYDAVRESLIEGPRVGDVMESVGSGGQVEVYSLSSEEVRVDYEIIESRALIDGLRNYAVSVTLGEVLGGGGEAVATPKPEARGERVAEAPKPKAPAAGGLGGAARKAPSPRAAGRPQPQPQRVPEQRGRGGSDLIAVLESLVDDEVLSRKVSDPAFMARVLLTPPETEAVFGNDFTSVIDRVLKDGGGRVVTVMLGDGAVLHILVNGTGKVGVCLSGAWGKVCGREALRRLREGLSSGDFSFVRGATILTYRIGGA